MRDPYTGEHVRPEPSRRRFTAVFAALAVLAGAFLVGQAVTRPAADPSVLSVVEECQQALGYPARTNADKTWLKTCIHALTPPTVSPSGSPSPTVPPPSATPTPTVSPSPSPTMTTPPPTTTPPPSPSPTTTSPGGVLDLPRIAWEGGPAYWKQFPNAVDWTNPAFFPIGVWYPGFSSNAEVQWDKAHGINFYTPNVYETSDFGLIAGNGMYWVGGKVNSTFLESSHNWPGIMIDDEVDGRFSTTDGFALLSSEKAATAGTGKFAWANFSQLVMGGDMPVADQQTYVNNFTDVVSLDMYWYTIPFCDWTPYRGLMYADPVPQATCRTANSYGHSMNGLTVRDSADSKLQPRWAFVEMLNGMGSDPWVANITPAQLKGAAMDSIINEARGITWFAQSFSGPCQTSYALRTAQISGPGWCGSADVEAMGQINAFITSLAPVINTQSYVWTFGAGLDTMLKVYNGSAYVLAMTDGTSGGRVLTLPPGVTGTSVEVVGEARTIPVSNGAFADNFAAESTYHVYRIAL